MPINHCSTHSSGAPIPPLYSSERTLQKCTLGHGKSYRTVYRDVKHDKEDTRALAEFLNSKGGEDGNGGTHPKIKQMETLMMPERKL